MYGQRYISEVTQSRTGAVHILANIIHVIPQRAKHPMSPTCLTTDIETRQISRIVKSL